VIEAREIPTQMGVKSGGRSHEMKANLDAYFQFSNWVGNFKLQKSINNNKSKAKNKSQSQCNAMQAKQRE
jgi:hypothetical protein